MNKTKQYPEDPQEQKENKKVYKITNPKPASTQICVISSEILQGNGKRGASFKSQISSIHNSTGRKIVVSQNDYMNQYFDEEFQNQEQKQDEPYKQRQDGPKSQQLKNATTEQFQIESKSKSKSQKLENSSLVGQNERLRKQLAKRDEQLAKRDEQLAKRYAYKYYEQTKWAQTNIYQGRQILLSLNKKKAQQKIIQIQNEQMLREYIQKLIEQMKISYQKQIESYIQDVQKQYEKSKFNMQKNCQQSEKLKLDLQNKSNQKEKLKSNLKVFAGKIFRKYMEGANILLKTNEQDTIYFSAFCENKMQIYKNFYNQTLGASFQIFQKKAIDYFALQKNLVIAEATSTKKYNFLKKLNQQQITNWVNSMWLSAYDYSPFFVTFSNIQNNCVYNQLVNQVKQFFANNKNIATIYCKFFQIMKSKVFHLDTQKYDNQLKIDQKSIQKILSGLKISLVYYINQSIHAFLSSKHKDENRIIYINTKKLDKFLLLKQGMLQTYLVTVLFHQSAHLLLRELNILKNTHERSLTQAIKSKIKKDKSIKGLQIDDKLLDFGYLFQHFILGNVVGYIRGSQFSQIKFIFQQQNKNLCASLKKVYQGQTLLRAIEQRQNPNTPFFLMCRQVDPIDASMVFKFSRYQCCVKYQGEQKQNSIQIQNNQERMSQSVINESEQKQISIIEQSVQQNSNQLITQFLLHKINQ